MIEFRYKRKSSKICIKVAQELKKYFSRDSEKVSLKVLEAISTLKILWLKEKYFIRSLGGCFSLCHFFVQYCRTKYKHVPRWFNFLLFSSTVVWYWIWVDIVPWLTRHQLDDSFVRLLMSLSCELGSRSSDVGPLSLLLHCSCTVQLSTSIYNRTIYLCISKCLHCTMYNLQHWGNICVVI